MEQLLSIFISDEFKRCFIFSFMESFWVEVAIFVLVYEKYVTIKEYWRKYQFIQYLRLRWLKLKNDNLSLMRIVCCAITSLISICLYSILDEYELFIVMENCHIPFVQYLIDVYLLQRISLLDNAVKYLPLLAPLYYFYFREQRTISESYLIEVDVSFKNLIMVSCSATGCLMLGKADKTITIAVVFFFMVTFIWLWIFITSFFHRLKPIALASMASKEAIRWLEIVLICYEKKLYIQCMPCFSEALCNRISLSFEILYQVIDYSLSKGVNKVLRECLNMLQDTISAWVNATEHLPYLIQPGTKQYELCRDILKNHKDLCISLHKERRTIEFDKTINILFNAFPHQMQPKTMEDKLVLVDEYFKTYWSVFVYLLNEDRTKFQIFADEMFNLRYTDKEIIDNILVLRALIVEAVNAGNLTHMIEISFLLIKFTGIIENEYKLNDKINKQDFWKNYIEKTNFDAKENYKGIILYILLQALIKTIELEHYNLTGYIVKHIVSNYGTGILTKVCKHILHNKAYIDKRLRVENLFKRLNVRFNINEETAIYCLKKAMIMLRVQQIYMGKKEKSLLPLIIFEKYNDEFTISYCVKKILSVGDKYGMISLLDTSLLDNYIK